MKLNIFNSYIFHEIWVVYLGNYGVGFTTYIILHAVIITKIRFNIPIIIGFFFFYLLFKFILTPCWGFLRFCRKCDESTNIKLFDCEIYLYCLFVLEILFSS